jgi:hypothetical protein
LSCRVTDDVASRSPARAWLRTLARVFRDAPDGLAAVLFFVAPDPLDDAVVFFAGDVCFDAVAFFDFVAFVDSPVFFAVAVSASCSSRSAITSRRNRIMRLRCVFGVALHFSLSARLCAILNFRPVQVSYAVTKRRAGRAPEGSGVPIFMPVYFLPS